jgi:predicted amino acid racemase
VERRRIGDEYIRKSFLKQETQNLMARVLVESRSQKVKDETIPSGSFLGKMGDISILFAVRLALATEARVDMDTFEANIKVILDRIGSKRALRAVVKDNAYGHGSVSMAFAAVAVGAQCVAVDTVSEGLKLRKAGIKVPILLMGQASYSSLIDVVAYKLTPFIGDEDYAKMLSNAAAKARRSICVHLMINSGMNCFGYSQQDAPDLAARIISLPFLPYGGTLDRLRRLVPSHPA